jgi:hypothetical protein
MFQEPNDHAEETLLKKKLSEQNQVIYKSLAEGKIDESQASSILNILAEVARSNYEFAEALTLFTETQNQ